MGKFLALLGALALAVIVGLALLNGISRNAGDALAWQATGELGRAMQIQAVGLTAAICILGAVVLGVMGLAAVGMFQRWIVGRLEQPVRSRVQISVPQQKQLPAGSEELEIVEALFSEWGGVRK